MTLRQILVGGLVAFSLSGVALAETRVVEGDEAKALYDKLKLEFNTLRQSNKAFTLVAPDGTETPKPKKLTVAPDELIFITNEEEKFVHNVYDRSDRSWVLKKQEPGGTAAISFSEPGEHKLRCAIHPKMKITVKVE